MRKNLTTRIAVLTAVAGLAISMSACNSGDDSAGGDKQGGGGDSKSDSGKPADDKPFGPACADVPKSGDGSFDGMAEDPVATAAGNNKELSTLVEAVGKADLADTLNSSEDITVFAPANSAFEDIPKKDLDALLKDKDKLTDVLTYHVVGETVTPDKLGKDGPYESLQGAKVKTSGSGEKVKINDDAGIACGNVQTANATVYIIDSVLMPPEK